MHEVPWVTRKGKYWDKMCSQTINIKHGKSSMACLTSSFLLNPYSKIYLLSGYWTNLNRNELCDSLLQSNQTLLNLLTVKFWHCSMTRTYSTSNLEPLDLLVHFQKALFSSIWDLNFLRTEGILYNLKQKLCIFQMYTIAYTHLRLDAELTRWRSLAIVIQKARLHEIHIQP